MPNETMHDTAKRFMDALKTIEQEGTPDAILELFSDDATLERLSQRSEYRGHDGAREFWNEYLHAFGEVDTTFHTTLRDGDTVALEWESRGSLPSGEPLHYRGVSVLEFDGERVQRFRTYYDSATFLPEGASR